MPNSLHTNKIKDEKDAFVNELFDMIPKREELISGEASAIATQIHKLYLAIYIMNHFKSQKLKTDYYEYLLTSVIESESLVLCGFINAAVMQLRSAVEMAFKMNYYENHPVECDLHMQGKHELKGIEYREFLYIHPKFTRLSNIKRDNIELLWSDLCKYSHFDISVINEVGVIQDMKSVFTSSEEKKSYEKKLKSCCRLIVLILFLIDSSWLKGVEKSYFDYVFEILYTSVEARELKIALGIE